MPDQHGDDAQHAQETVEAVLSGGIGAEAAGHGYNQRRLRCDIQPLPLLPATPTRHAAQSALAPLAAAQFDPEVTQRLGRVGFRNRNHTLGQQCPERSLERPEADAIAAVRSQAGSGMSRHAAIAAFPDWLAPSVQNNGAPAFHSAVARSHSARQPGRHRQAPKRLSVGETSMPLMPREG